MIDFVDEQGFDNDCLTLYAEEQLERCLLTVAALFSDRPRSN